MTSSADVAETGLTYKGRTNVLLHLRSPGCSAAGCAAYVNKAALHNQRDTTNETAPNGYSAALPLGALPPKTCRYQMSYEPRASAFNADVGGVIR